MLDYKKVGQFICQERQKRNLTQEELGELLFVTRQAISKWERGLCMPDYDSLLHLSEIFSLDLNEIIKGQKRKKTKAYLCSAIFFVFIFIFCAYFFILNSKQVKIFKFFGQNENVSVNNIIGIFSSKNSYLKLNSFSSTILKKYNYIEISYLKENKKYILCKTADIDALIINSNCYKDIKYILNHLYFTIYYDNKTETIKLETQNLLK